MATILFKNQFLLTRKLHKEYCKSMFYTRRKKLRITWAIISLVLIAAGIFLKVFLNFKVLPPILFFLGAVFAYSVFFGYKCSEWINYRKICNENSAVPGLEAVIFIDFLPVQVTVKFGNAGYAFKYTSIVDTIETENLIILILQAPGMIEHAQLIFKGGFTDKSQDTLDRFLHMIAEKSGKESKS